MKTKSNFKFMESRSMIKKLGDFRNVIHKRFPRNESVLIKLHVNTDKCNCGVGLGADVSQSKCTMNQIRSISFGEDLRHNTLGRLDLKQLNRRNSNLHLCLKTEFHRTPQTVEPNSPKRNNHGSHYYT